MLCTVLNLRNDYSGLIFQNFNILDGLKFLKIKKKSFHSNIIFVICICQSCKGFGVRLFFNDWLILYNFESLK